MKTEKYRLTSSIFKGSNEFGFTYELTFNKSLQHTGKFSAIEKGLNNYDKMEPLRCFYGGLKQIGYALKMLFKR